MYPNLNAEMARLNITQKEICNILKINSSTLSDKMNGKKDFKLKECKQIKKIFDKFSIDYLFKRFDEIEEISTNVECI